MTEDPPYPRPWLDRVPAVVFACLLPGEIKVLLSPGAGLADGGVPANVPMEKIPPELRLPSTPIWIRYDQDWKVVQVWRRHEDD